MCTVGCCVGNVAVAGVGAWCVCCSRIVGACATRVWCMVGEGVVHVLWFVVSSSSPFLYVSLTWLVAVDWSCFCCDVDFQFRFSFLHCGARRKKNTHVTCKMFSGGYLRAWEIH